MSRALPLLFLAAVCYAQDVTDVTALAKTVTAGTVTLVTVTAPDGTVCKLAKVAGATVSAVAACGSSDGKNVLRTVQIQGTGTVPFATLVGLFQTGSPLCLIVTNPLAVATTAFSATTVPAHGMAWQCTADGISANIQQGSAVWP